MSHAFFNNSGSEANDTAIKIIWYYNNARGRPRKKKIIARYKSYHGVTVATASLSGLPNNHKSFDLPIAGIRHADCPHHYRFAHAGESEEDFATRLAENLELMIQREDPDTVAAFFAEPVMGAGGVIVPPRTYYEKIQSVLKKYDVLLVADEVITGFGRTGKMFGTETFGLKPDIITVAKALSSAYLPISATIVNDAIYQAMADESSKIGIFAHGYTYSGHPVCCAVAIEALKIYEERNILAHVQKVAPRLQEGLRRFASHPIVGEVRGVGLVAAVELVGDKASKAPFDPGLGAGNLLNANLYKHGLILRQIGDAMAFSPPLVVSEAEIGDMLDRFGKALDDTEAALAPRQSDPLRA
jgi:4-aminobutyrate--pyruvate transaminase